MIRKIVVIILANKRHKDKANTAVSDLLHNHIAGDLGVCRSGERIILIDRSLVHQRPDNDNDDDDGVDDDNDNDDDDDDDDDDNDDDDDDDNDIGQWRCRLVLKLSLPLTPSQSLPFCFRHQRGHHKARDAMEREQGGEPAAGVGFRGGGGEGMQWCA